MLSASTTNQISLFSLRHKTTNKEKEKSEKKNEKKKAKYIQCVVDQHEEIENKSDGQTGHFDDLIGRTDAFGNECDPRSERFARRGLQLFVGHPIALDQENQVVNSIKEIFELFETVFAIHFINDVFLQLLHFLCAPILESQFRNLEVDLFHFKKSDHCFS
jgi:hypothetical protein